LALCYKSRVEKKVLPNQLHISSMSKSYIVYSLTLFSSFVVYWCFALMSTVAAGIDWVPIVSFIASIIHFGISSWLFFIYPKTGRVLAVITALLLAIWPIIGFATSFVAGSLIESVFYLMPLLCIIFIIYSHLKNFGNEHSMPSSIARTISIISPLSAFLYVVAYMIMNRL
jgi:hypothetical protein